MTTTTTVASRTTRRRQYTPGGWDPTGRNISRPRYTSIPAGRAGRSDGGRAAPCDDAPVMGSTPGRRFADRVLAWYATEARDLPWRRPDAGAWAVLVSEVMLQQTPVQRV